MLNRPARHSQPECAASDAAHSGQQSLEATHHVMGLSRLFADRLDPMHVFVTESNTHAGLVCAASGAYDLGRVRDRAVDWRVVNHRGANCWAMSRSQVHDIADVDRHLVEFGMSAARQQFRRRNRVNGVVHFEFSLWLWKCNDKP